MKKYIVFIALIIGINLHAQDKIDAEAPNDNVKFVIKAGWVNSSVEGKDQQFLANVDGKIKHQNDFMIGVGVDNPIGENFNLKHEIYYHNYGAEFNREVNGHEISADLNMHGIRINPVSLGYRLNGFELFVGPYINVLTNSSISSVDENGNKIKDHDIFGTETEDQEDGYFLQNMDFGAVVGAEYEFDFGGLIGVQYSRGFATIFDNANIYENEGPDGDPDFKLYNQTVSVYLGYKF